MYEPALVQAIEKLNIEYHGSSWNVQKHQRMLSSDKGDFILFQTPRRKKYNQKAHELIVRSLKMPRARCDLCESVDGLIFANHLLVTRDSTPFAAHHSLLRFLNKNTDHDKLYIRQHLNPDIHAHRERAIKEDIDACGALARATGYLICHSQRGSGASIPWHIHAHAFKRDENDPDCLYLPQLTSQRVRRVGERQGLVISRTVTSAYGTLLEGDAGRFGEQIIKAHKATGIPFNFVMGSGSPFAGLWALVFWREKESPSHHVFFATGFGRWRFGFAEMLGLFEYKTEEQRERLDADLLNSALSETTVSDPEMRARIEQLLLND